jgi:hypothetical protein
MEYLVMSHSMNPIDILRGTRSRAKRGGIINAGESKSVLHTKNADGSARPRLPNCLVADQHGSVTLLKLSRPAKRNALDDATIAGALRMAWVVSAPVDAAMH